VKNKILISACILGENCRYDGKNCSQQFLINANVEWLPVCPEVQGNLETPRAPAELQGNAEEILRGNSRILNNVGEDVTSNFINGTKKCIEIANRENITFAILKSRSPSCGVGEVYDGSFSGNLTKGDGLFSHLCQKNGIKIVSSDDYSAIQRVIGRK